jgi:hypothetical protein
MNRNDAICIAYTYHFADLCIQGRHAAKRALGRDLFNDSNRILDLYHALVEDIAGDILPDEWQPRYDHWGGKCFSTSTTWRDPQDRTIMAGEYGGYLCCDSEQAIREHMQTRLADYSELVTH